MRAETIRKKCTNIIANEFNYTTAYTQKQVNSYLQDKLLEENSLMNYDQMTAEEKLLERLSWRDDDIVVRLASSRNLTREELMSVSKTSRNWTWMQIHAEFPLSNESIVWVRPFILNGQLVLSLDQLIRLLFGEDYQNIEKQRQERLLEITRSSKSNE